MRVNPGNATVNEAWVSEPERDIAPGALPPGLSVGDPTDALAMLMVSMQQLSEASLDQTEHELRVNQERLDERLGEFLTKLNEALKAAREQKPSESRGWFGKIVDCVSDVIGDVVGAQVDFMKDAFEAPFELGYAAITQPGDIQAFVQALSGQLEELRTDGDWAKSVDGFTEGAIRFSMDMARFSAIFPALIAEAAVTGELSSGLLVEESKRAWQSLQQNILENPEFWDVASVVGKAAAVTAIVGSGGALAPIAIGLMVLSEVDQRAPFIHKVVGEEAAPWVQLGLQAGVVVCAGFGTQSEIAGWAARVGGAVSVLAGVQAANTAVKSVAAAKAEHQVAKREAAILATMNQLQQLQRLKDDLVELYRERSQASVGFKELGAAIYNIQADNNASLVMRA